MRATRRGGLMLALAASGCKPIVAGEAVAWMGGKDEPPVECNAGRLGIEAVI